MVELDGKVAVVTGAASGIGRSLAARFADVGMRVVLADVEQPALDDAAHEAATRDARAIAVRTDVSSADDVEALARRTIDAFGAVHVVCNNAGVAWSGAVWEATLEDWTWVLGVNLWGVIHGVRSFVPRLLAQGGFGHVVNTASMSGLVCLPDMGVYNASKHAVVAISETLHHDLRQRGSAIGVSVLCPGYVDTRIMDSARNRPPDLAATRPDAREAAPNAATDEDREARRAATRAALRAVGRTPTEVAARVLDAIQTGRFYVLTHPERKDGVRTRMEAILEETDPRFVPLA
ncbi:MAG TPA: SDR family NAD(P)-dependent oxidoreductase [Candidatus Binatia bacterium]|nr:SDR family NAD(P)-dependent oxidoreductase [Candidatus Binatia bacterium]